MVTRDYMRESAIHWFRRKGTETARAMLRALGIEMPAPVPEPGTVASLERYGDMGECFANRGTPMDGRMGAAF